MPAQFGPQFEIGIPSIDAQHARLFQIAAEVEGGLALPPEASQAAMVRAVRDLVDYTRIHFAHEEALMSAAQFPSLHEHQLMHQELLRQVQELEMRIDIEDDSTALDLSRFLANWLRQHIQSADREFAGFATPR